MIALTLGAAWLSSLLGGAPTLYGVLFAVAAVAGALWVRPADLICAPIAAPPAFALGLLLTSDLANVPTELALQASWLFTGTLLAALTALGRRVLALLRRPYR